MASSDLEIEIDSKVIVPNRITRDMDMRKT